MTPSTHMLPHTNDAFHPHAATHKSINYRPTCCHTTRPRHTHSLHRQARRAHLALASFVGYIGDKREASHGGRLRGTKKREAQSDGLDQKAHTSQMFKLKSLSEVAGMLRNPEQEGSHAREQSGGRAVSQSVRQAGSQTGGQVGRQAGRQASRQAGRQALQQEVRQAG
eukprot:2950-Chlamydomonas_euryale.AAC.1